MKELGNLRAYLLDRPEGEGRVQLSFEQIEGIVGRALPLSALLHEEWWINWRVGDAVQSQCWLTAGWWVEAVDVREGWVVFVRRGKPRIKKVLDV
jgi:hypothetical protein